MRRVRELGSSAARFMGTPWVCAYVPAEVVLALAVSALFRSTIGLYALDAVLFFPVFAFHLHSRRFARLTGIASLWGISKSIVFIGSVWLSGSQMDSFVSGGPAYHADTLSWIRTGEGTNAHPEVFAWHHVWGLGHVAMTGVASCGLTTLIGGSRELNIMNFHVAKLLQDARAPWRIVFFGWPMWSLLRGWAYLLVLLGAAPLFFCIIKREKPPFRPLGVFFLAGCALAGVDLGLKTLFAPAWRLLLLSAL